MSKDIAKLPETSLRMVHYGGSLWCHTIFNIGTSKRQDFFLKIGIKTVLVIQTENLKRLCYIINMPCVLQHKRYYMDKIVLMSFNLFNENITDQGHVTLPVLFVYRE